MRTTGRWSAWLVVATLWAGTAEAQAITIRLNTVEHNKPIDELMCARSVAK